MSKIDQIGESAANKSSPSGIRIRFGRPSSPTLSKIIKAIGKLKE